MIEKAEMMIEKEKIIYFTQQDSDVFFNALDNPPKINKKLKNAILDYKKKLFLPLKIIKWVNVGVIPCGCPFFKFKQGRPQVKHGVSRIIF